MDAVSSPRAYDNSARAQAAADTRGRILDAAGAMLLDGGYHSMSVAGLASAAGVSPQTVYNSVGGKADVVKAVYDVLLAGDENPVPMSSRPEFLAMGEAPDRDAFGRAYAAFGAGIWRRVGPLLGVLLADGAGSDTTLAAFVATIDGERLTGNTHAITMLETRHGLPDGRGRGSWSTRSGRSPLPRSTTGSFGDAGGRTTRTPPGSRMPLPARARAREALRPADSRGGSSGGEPCGQPAWLSVDICTISAWQGD